VTCWWRNCKRARTDPRILRTLVKGLDASYPVLFYGFPDDLKALPVLATDITPAPERRH
jgi:hypothetical protein